MTNGIDRDALAREMGEQLKRLMYDLGNGNPWSLANFMSEIAMRHIAAARAEALEEAALKCDALTKFGDAFPSNGNSKAWARAPNPRPHGAAGMTDRDAPDADGGGS
jgi:hypothetical protein